MPSASFGSFFSGGTAAPQTSGFFRDAEDPAEAEARRRAQANRDRAYALAQGGVDRAGAGSPDDAALRQQLGSIASGQGGAGGAQARAGEIARATDQAAAAAGARAMAAVGGQGVNAGPADRSFAVQNLTQQQQDVQRARQGFDATLGAQGASDRLSATSQLANISARDASQRQAAEDRLREMLLSEEFSAADAGGPTDAYGRPIKRSAGGGMRLA